MSRSRVVIYKNEDGSAPLLQWLDELSPGVVDKCIVKVELLEKFGYQLRRPHCDLLEEGIYELRVRYRNIHYRILYFFEGKNTVILSHGCTKEKRVSKREVARAIRHRANYIENPQGRSYSGEL